MSLVCRHQVKERSHPEWQTSGGPQLLQQGRRNQSHEGIPFRENPPREVRHPPRLHLPEEVSSQVPCCLMTNKRGHLRARGPGVPGCQHRRQHRQPLKLPGDPPRYLCVSEVTD